jgi:hypothetical protein
MSDAHLRFRGAAAAHLAEVLPGEEAAWMESHAAGCAHCSKLLARVQPLLRTLSYEAGHAPVSLLERWVLSPEELTPLERALLEHHFAECALCRDDALEMARLAGIPRTAPRRAVATPVQRPATVTIVLREPLLGSTAESVALALIPVPKLVLEFHAPFLAVFPKQWVAMQPTRTPLALTLIGVDGVPVWTGVQSGSPPTEPIRLPVPPTGWAPGLYRLEVATIIGTVQSFRRSYLFRLVASR